MTRRDAPNNLQLPPILQPATRAGDWLSFDSPSQGVFLLRQPELLTEASLDPWGPIAVARQARSDCGARPSAMAQSTSSAQGLGKVMVSATLLLIFILGFASRLFLTLRYAWLEVNEFDPMFQARGE
jgi:hypothetical protein